MSKEWSEWVAVLGFVVSGPLLFALTRSTSEMRWRRIVGVIPSPEGFDASENLDRRVAGGDNGSLPSTSRGS